MQQTIFITGASSGLGKATAKLFQRKGWNVIATMRNPASETELNQLDNVTLLPLDVTDPLQVKETVGQALALGAVDVVFNNAGYGLMGPLEALTDEQIVKEVNTNLLGVIRVTQAFIPAFREKGTGTFITTTSIGGSVAFPISSIYHATKFALEGWSESMWYELKTLNIAIKTVAPGGIYTDFAGRSMEQNTLPHYQSLVERMFGSFEQSMQSASTPEFIAETVFEAATDGKDQLKYVAGKDAVGLYARREEIGQLATMREIEQLFIG
ncbi:SDR family oxidoreductase [Fibrisoma montanum]|uniref:SDR family oxidoreductase n=1 Tax=Fibrisoma montanum TaxID=2305895 RepID=A0A418LZ21_9BACT|nr:SDR family oxidoreductase [Fibrisoma montanum]RIV18626.1 SDR family oxidoreductase [Fibrisoma montanum]